MRGITKDLKYFFKEYRYLAWALFAAFIPAFLGDWIYGGVRTADNYFIGIFLGQLSQFLFTVFFIMVLVKLMLKVFFSKYISQLMKHVEERDYPEPEVKSKVKKK